MTIRNPGDVAAIVAVVTAVLAGLLYLIRAQAALMREFRPNGGNSTKDQLTRMEYDMREVRSRLDQHIDNHNR